MAGRTTEKLEVIEMESRMAFGMIPQMLKAAGVDTTKDPMIDHTVKMMTEAVAVLMEQSLQLSREYCETLDEVHELTLENQKLLREIKAMKEKPSK